MLHSTEVDALVSPVSAIEGVRLIITDLLRSIALNKSIVMVGRDIGTVVLKDAFLKVYLAATYEERALRRFKELIGKGITISYREVLKNIRERDLIDSSRSYSPLSIANDAYVIDTTNLSVGEVVGKILSFLDGREYALRNSAYNRKTSF
jgi:cytidylate kinase